ncbi:MAG: M1 family aminopeptidase, partial [Bacteroidota bacterium]
PWIELPETTVKIFEIIEQHYGKYPYKQYSVIQGGDGGMEYPMCTLINGTGGKGPVESVTIHEVIHSWFQMVLASNEALYPWIDEGFTTYASNVVKKELYQREGNVHEGTYRNYFYYASAGAEEPMSTHADHYNTNGAYSIGTYVKGAVFLNQLEYVVGKENFDKGMLAFYDQWAFKHPGPNDFIRVMEKQSGLELDWYKEYFVNSTKTIDYGIKSVEEKGNQIIVDLERIGYMPMPIDLVIDYKDGSRSIINIPLRIMRGEKDQEDQDADYVVEKDWPWVNVDYQLSFKGKLKKIASITIDLSERMADLNRENNQKTFD